MRSLVKAYRSTGGWRRPALWVVLLAAAGIVAAWRIGWLGGGSWGSQLPPSRLLGLPAPSSPPISALLSRDRELALSPQQHTQLRALERNEDAATGPLQDRVDADRAAFDRSVNALRENGPVPLPRMEALAQPLVEDSRTLDRLQEVFWTSALGLLSPSQQQQARQLIPR